MNTGTKGIAEEIREDGSTNCLVCGFNIDIAVSIHNTGRRDCCDNCAMDRREEYLRKALSAMEDRLRSLLEENERLKRHSENARKEALETLEQGNRALDTLHKLHQQLREELEQVKKERDAEAEKKRETYRNLNEWQHRVYDLEAELAAKDKVLKDISTNSLCSWAKDNASGILSQYAINESKESP